MRDRIGPALREARLQRRLSLRSVAAAAGISASLLSQVETGKSQPSVSTLYALVSHMGISLDDLLGIASPEGGEPESSSATGTDERRRAVPQGPAVVQRAADNPVLEMDNGVRWERLAVGSHRDVDPLLVTYQPGAASSIERKLMRHSGVEYAYLFEGELTLLLGFDRHTIGPGDSFCFDSTTPHLYVNHGSVPARGLWFVTGRHDLDYTRAQVEVELADLHHPGAEPTPANAVDVLELLDSTRSADSTPLEAEDVR